MSWKMYSLGNCNGNTGVYPVALSKLEELGYAPSFESGQLTVTIGGVAYTSALNAPSGTIPYYLCVNDETNDIVISTIYANALYPSTSLNYTICFALLSGTNILTGESGVFPVNPGMAATNYSNAQTVQTATNIMLLQRAVFTSAYSEYYCPYNFKSTLYWGSIALTPSVVAVVGEDRFVCLGGFLYAKL